MTTCPCCGTSVTVHLRPDQVCPTCESTDAWAHYAEPGRRLRIDASSIRESVARRSVRRAPLATRALPCVVAFGFGVASLVALWRLHADRAMAPLDDVLASVEAAAGWTFGLGAAALASGVVAAVLLARSRLFRMWALTGLCTVAVGAGLVTSVVGGLRLAVDIDWRHTSMPPLATALADLSGIGRIMAATTVIIAPDGDGDASNPAIGTGAIVQSAGSRAWIVTCSHVAMPYAAVAAHRDAADAHPVWVYFADGRSVEGRVTWTAQPPLDVALISVTIPNPPQAVAVATSEQEILAAKGSLARFVPNPFRAGWLHHRGTISGRRTHVTPAGNYSLVLTDLPLQPGDSGSGLFDERGRLIGLNTWAAAGRADWSGISLPSSAMRRVTELIEKGDLNSLDLSR